MTGQVPAVRRRDRELRRGPAVTTSADPQHPAVAAPFTRVAVCSGPATDRLEIADLVTTEANRWSGAGEPTLYLAGDMGTALAEVGRHWEPGPGRLCLWHVHLDLRAAVDLRRPDVRSAVGVPDDPRWFLDRGRCRDMAARLRRDGSDGLIVPSVAFLDDLSRWNAVVFVDQASGLQDVVRTLRPLADIGYES